MVRPPFSVYAMQLSPSVQALVVLSSECLICRVRGARSSSTSIASRFTTYSICRRLEPKVHVYCHPSEKGAPYLGFLQLLQKKLTSK
ncbi:hypothetical protein C8R42DRAFT_650375 [Lentinula raphanica]|nr:hypothetical protein C8R42DRAFT_650375 [Lentinula raphanica]